MSTSVDKICETCRYWSELITRSYGPKPSLEALCLNREGPFIAFFVAAPSAARPGPAGIWARSMTQICRKELMPNHEV
jgi:hypothetical protein